MVQIKEKFLKRARAKYITRRFVLAMMEHNSDSTLRQSYINTLYCNQSLHKVDDKIISTYCKNRWCIVCGRIRAANLINGYIAEFEKFDDAHFVTLTLPTTESLFDRVKEMEAQWRLLIELARKFRFESFRGLRKKECTLRPDNHYHYHYHVIIDRYDNANWLVKQWLKRFPQANEKAQDIRKADERSYKELFKYFTKLVTTDKEGRLIKEFERLDYVFRALKGKRIFEPFGIRKIDENFDDVELRGQLVGLRGKVWRWAILDWENEFGDVLCGYEPSEQLLKLLQECPE